MNRFSFWGLYAAFAVILAAYFVWMRWKERSD